MRKANRLFACFLSVCFVLNTHSANAVRATDSGATYKVLSSNELSYLVFNRTSPFHNSEALFWDIQNSPVPIRKAYESEIAEDPALKAFSSEGNKFRDFYLNTLNQGFVGEMVQWATDPDAAVYRDLVRFNMRVEQQNRETPDPVASRKAWREALSKNGLPDDLSHDDVSEKARDNQTYEKVLQLYRRLYLVYLDETTRQLDRSPFDFQEFLREVERKINRAREANFKQAIEILSTLRKQPMDFISLLDKSHTRVSIEELSKSKIVFVKNSADRGTHRLKVEKWFDWYLNIVDSFATAKKGDDVTQAEAFFKTHFYQPSNPTYLISLDFGSYELNLSERNYAEVLHQLLNQVKIGESVDRVWNARYIMEASRRDVMLSDSLAFLKRQRTSLSALIRTYSERVDRNRSVPNNSPMSLTQRLRGFNEINLDAGNLTGVRWAGYQVHPDYWLVRDAVSKRAGGIDYTEALKKGGKIDGHLGLNFEEIQAAKQFVKTDNREKANKPYREGSPSRRSRIFAFTLAVTMTVVLSAAGGIIALTSALVRSALGDGGTSRTLEMTDNDVHKNNSFDKSEGNGEVIFDVERLKPGAPLPVYYNELGESNLPEVMQHGFNKLGVEPNLVSEIKLVDSDKTQADVKITTNVPYLATDGRVPILTPDHYQIKSIKVTLNGVELNPAIDYKVYQVPYNGLYYFEVANASANRKYRYEVSFSATTPRGLPQQISELDRSTLRDVTENLRNSGATELSDGLNKELQGQKKVNLDKIGAIFSHNGVYTFDKRGSKKGSPENPFYSATQYLREDGVYYFQCTGSNYVLGTYLKEVYRQNETLRNRVKVEQVSGFVLQNEEGYLTFPGHRRTLVSDVRLENRYVILDATPVKMDPKYQDQKEQHPFYWKEKNNQSPQKRPVPSRDVFLRRKDSELRLVDSDKDVTPHTQQRYDKTLAERVDALKKLKGELRESILGLIRESGRTIKSDTIHSSVQDLFFLVDLVAASFAGKKGKELLVDELIAYQTGIHSFGSGNYQAEQFNELRTQYLLKFGSEDNIITSFLDDVSDRFSKILKKVAESDQRGERPTHGYLLDERVRWISSEILKSLGESWVRDSFTTRRKCNALLAQ
ncbi:MAG: hypothetical protein IPJ71_04735 [Bdellovibrionales bacterium]|nr:hypothetical protein [Bdellovibrionales bacterium]